VDKNHTQNNNNNNKYLLLLLTFDLKETSDFTESQIIFVILTLISDINETMKDIHLSIFQYFLFFIIIICLYFQGIQ
jgi:hypothetical protein